MVNTKRTLRWPRRELPQLLSSCCCGDGERKTNFAGGLAYAYACALALAVFPENPPLCRKQKRTERIPVLSSCLLID